MPRTGWHCTACNRYFQTPTSEPPTACRHCGTAGPLRRIAHDRQPADVAVGAVVACEILSETHEYVVGEVVAVTDDDRIVVESRDGTGRYEVTPDQIVEVREAG